MIRKYPFSINEEDGDTQVILSSKEPTQEELVEMAITKLAHLFYEQWRYEKMEERRRRESESS